MDEQQTQEIGKVDPEAEGWQEPQPNGKPDEGTSLMDSLRAMRERKAAEAPPRYVLDVPGYENRLAVIYRYPESGYQQAVKAVEREVEGKQPNARLDGATDLLVAACAAVVGRDDRGNLADLVTGDLLGPDSDPEVPANAMRFDRRLAEALQIDVPAEVKGVGRHVARQLFSPRGAATGVYDGDLALIAASNLVFRWLNGREDEIDEDTLGE